MDKKKLWNYFILYIKQLFDIGNSTGSLFTEAITLFRTFQQISAPSDFKVKLPPEYSKIFEWAREIVDIVSRSIRTIPFSDFEQYSLYSISFTLTILMFIMSASIGNNFIIMSFICILLFFVGLGGSMMYYNKMSGLMLIGFCGGFSIICIISLFISPCLKLFSCCKKRKKMNQ